LFKWRNLESASSTNPRQCHQMKHRAKSDSTTKQNKLHDHPIPIKTSLSLSSRLSFPSNDEDRSIPIKFVLTTILVFIHRDSQSYQCCDENPPCLTKKKLEEKKFGDDESFYFSKNLLASEYWKEKPVLNYSTNEITTTSFDIGCDYFGLLFILNSILIIYETLVRNVKLFFHISHNFLQKKIFSRHCHKLLSKNPNLKAKLSD